MLRRLTLLCAILLTLPYAVGCQLAALAVGNAGHMTIGRATAAREVKRFRVLDAATGLPVVGARVVMVHDFDWSDDWSMTATTDAEGVATFRLARAYLHLLEGSVSAAGYAAFHTQDFGDPLTGPLADDVVDIRISRQLPPPATQ